MLLLCAGCKAERLACSNSHVYVLDTAGELLVRVAVTSHNRQWHKVPGALNTIAGSGMSGLAYSTLHTYIREHTYRATEIVQRIKDVKTNLRLAFYIH